MFYLASRKAVGGRIGRASRSKMQRARTRAEGPEENPWRTLYLHIHAQNNTDGTREYYVAAHTQYNAPTAEEPMTLALARVQRANSRSVVRSLTILLSGMPHAETIRKIMCRPLPCFIAPHFVRFVRSRDLAIEYDDEMRLGRPRRPLRQLQDHQYSHRR